MQAPLTDRNDIKIFILYLMKAVGEPLDFVDINDIVVQNGIVSPFDFLDCFPELVKTGHIRLLEKENHTFYQLTALGSETVDSLESTLLNMTKESAKKNAFMLLELKKKNSDIRFGVEPDLNGGYQFWCNYYKNNRPVLKLSVCTETQDEAEWIERNFDMRPDEMSRAILSILKNKATDEIVPF